MLRSVDHEDCENTKAHNSKTSASERQTVVNIFGGVPFIIFGRSWNQLIFTSLMGLYLDRRLAEIKGFQKLTHKTYKSGGVRAVYHAMVVTQ